MAKNFVFNQAGNGLANFNDWTIPNYNNTGNAYSLNSADFVGLMPSVSLENFNGMTGTLGDQSFTLGTQGSSWGNAASMVGAGAGVLQGLGGLAGAYTAYHFAAAQGHHDEKESFRRVSGTLARQ